MEELIVRECSWCGSFLGIAYHTTSKPSPSGYLHTSGICKSCADAQLRTSRATIRIEKGYYDSDAVIAETADRMLAALKRGRNDELSNQAG